MATLMVDIDGTCADFSRMAARCLLDIGRPTGATECLVASVIERQWDVDSALELCGVSASELWDEVFSADRVMGSHAYPGAASALSWISRAGHDIRYVTARDGDSKDATAMWLTINGFPPGPLVMCGHEERVHECANMGPVVLCDDRPDTIELATEMSVSVVSKVHPYNAVTVMRNEVPSFKDWVDGVSVLMRALEEEDACAL